MKKEEYITTLEISKAYFNLYLQILAGLFVIGITLFILISIHKDIKNKLEIKQSEILFDIGKCRENYEVNKCEQGKLEALIEICHEYERCMNKNPYKVMYNINIGSHDDNSGK